MGVAAIRTDVKHGQFGAIDQHQTAVGHDQLGRVVGERQDDRLQLVGLVVLFVKHQHSFAFGNKSSKNICFNITNLEFTEILFGSRLIRVDLVLIDDVLHIAVLSVGIGYFVWICYRSFLNSGRLLLANNLFARDAR